MKFACILGFLFFLGVSGFAQAADFLPDPGQEARAVALGAELRCVVCQSESINDSQADMARDMRLLVRDKISQGWTNAQITDFIRARYGDFILLRPPFQPNTYLLWGGPLVVLVAAGLWIASLFKPRR